MSRLAAALALLLGPLSAPAKDVTVLFEVPCAFEGGTNAAGEISRCNVEGVGEGRYNPTTGAFTDSPEPADETFLAVVFHIGVSYDGPAPCHEEHQAPPDPANPFHLALTSTG